MRRLAYEDWFITDINIPLHRRIPRLEFPRHHHEMESSPADKHTLRRMERMTWVHPYARVHLFVAPREGLEPSKPPPLAIVPTLCFSHEIFLEPDVEKVVGSVIGFILEVIVEFSKDVAEEESEDVV
ncbi:hypothetical protein FS749_007860 [Ceratobasidium sp. UAMH 11750]|nr:hypothetical protein FS749_007860 [Ceratobasidium sp. UAMH 11750]